MPKKGIDQESKGLLIKIITELKNTIETEELFNDLLSSAEVKDFSRRLMAARYLTEGKTYLEVMDLMGMSASTVNKVHFKTKGSPIIWKLFKK